VYLMDPSPAAPRTPVVLMKTGDVAVPVPVLCMAISQRGSDQHCGNAQQAMSDLRFEAAGQTGHEQRRVTCS